MDNTPATVNSLARILKDLDTVRFSLIHMLSFSFAIRTQGHVNEWTSQPFWREDHVRGRALRPRRATGTGGLGKWGAEDSVFELDSIDGSAPNDFENELGLRLVLWGLVIGTSLPLANERC